MLKVPVTEADHIQGSAGAPAVLVEYGDYQCPHCGHAYPIVKRVQEHFGKKLGFVFRNFPLTEAHPDAENAAEAAEFAGANGRFWEMHDGIFENQELLGDDILLALAGKFGLSKEELSAAWGSGEFTSKVKSDFAGGVRSGVNGTPTFFINGRRHDGPFEFEDLRLAIEGALAQGKGGTAKG